jgi:hypothetical protein
MKLMGWGDETDAIAEVQKWRIGALD